MWLGLFVCKRFGPSVGRHGRSACKCGLAAVGCCRTGWGLLGTLPGYAGVPFPEDAGEYVIATETVAITNENVNANAGYENVSVTGYEMPRLDDRYVYADHYVTVNGVERLNYALEWNPDMRHANWVAFSFDSTSSADVVKRTDAWAVDPKLPEDMWTM